ncbi:MAG TPA: hypothetical protein DD452_00175 [Nitrospina sp.]|nr:hypothetical protein [Nitrospina sp.]HCK67964.1 hypothetical protein [Nitrospina sp.]
MSLKLGTVIRHIEEQGICQKGRSAQKHSNSYKIRSYVIFFAGLCDGKLNFKGKKFTLRQLIVFLFKFAGYQKKISDWTKKAKVFETSPLIYLQIAI